MTKKRKNRLPHEYKRQTRKQVHPAPVLEPLHRPLVPANDGQGYYTFNEFAIVREFGEAMNGDLPQLFKALSREVRRNKKNLKRAKGKPQRVVHYNHCDWPSLATVAEMLGLITAERPAEAGQNYREAPRVCVRLTEWFSDAVLIQANQSAKVKDELAAWNAGDGVHQRPRSEEWRMS